MSQVLNYNVGVLGHVDSGKTSLAKALSTVSSTASFDKNPQSQARGITLDLGFSSFRVRPLPAQLAGSGASELQYTLVDCPGHASLIKTIIGGAQIIDMMMLVIDVNKGIQTQTAECLVIGEITCPKMLIVLNKVDLIDPGQRTAAVDKMKKRLKAALARTKFADAPMVAVSANPESSQEPVGVAELIEQLNAMTTMPVRNVNGPFLFSVDHCFGIRGQGTVMTGTVLQGQIHVNENVEIVTIGESRKVKSMQMFKQPVTAAQQGDRVGICVAQFDAKLLERGLVAAPGHVPWIFGAIISLKPITYFKGGIASKAKFHISLGHETVLAKITLFEALTLEGGHARDGFNFEHDYSYLDEIGEDQKESVPKPLYALLEFEKSLPVVPDCKVLGSKLDINSNSPSCRLAFHGQLLERFQDKAYVSKDLVRLKIFKEKKKEGVVERASNACEVICKSMFKKETNLSLFSGLKVLFSTGETGQIEDSFGQSGKFKVRIPDGLQASTLEQLEARSKKSKKDSSSAPTTGALDPIHISLSFKKYIFSKKMAQ
eukprot:maker-scaffold995_size72343-snap-gene-0.24 protein:Tk07630 transcript:maker-scaffold995_size72343-snap-gene-0.24-mRNA-1 annotation:"selenocysteine-specific elongation factor"